MKFPSPTLCALPARGQWAEDRDMMAFGARAEKGGPQKLDWPLQKGLWALVGRQLVRQREILKKGASVPYVFQEVPGRSRGVLYCKEAGLVYLCPMLWDRVWETAYVWPGQESFFIGWGCSLNVVNQLLCVEGARHVCPAPNHLWLEPKGTRTLAGLSLHALFVAKKKKQSFDVYE